MLLYFPPCTTSRKPGIVFLPVQGSWEPSLTLRISCPSAPAQLISQARPGTVASLCPPFDFLLTEE